MITKQLQKKNQGSPILRFPEFLGEWGEKELSSFLIERNETTPKNDKYPLMAFVAYKGVAPKGERYNREFLVNDSTNKKYKKTEYGDFIYSSNNLETGSIGLNRYGSASISPVYSIFQIKESCDYQFMSSFLVRKRFINKMIRYRQGVVYGQWKIRESDFLKIKERIPQLSEQKKIASFLSSVYEWVENLQTQKENLEEYKKGMMQKIFSQEIRFKDDDGKNFPKWEEKKLEEILKERKEYSTKGKGYPHISLTTQGVVPKSERYNRDFLVGDDEVKGYKITRLNDLCYNPANLKFGVISINKLGAGIFSPIYVTFEIIGQNIDFVGYYLIRDEFINKARRYEQGTVYERMAVSPADFVKVKVAFPSLPEQQKIAYFLNSLDKAIEAKQQQITLAENWKKGLMQGLFI